MANLTTFDRRQVHMCPSQLLYMTAYSKKPRKRQIGWCTWISQKFSLKNSCFPFFLNPELSILIVNPVWKIISLIHSLKFCRLGWLSVGIGGSVWCHDAQILPSKSGNFGALDTDIKKNSLFTILPVILLTSHLQPEK